MLKPGLLIVLLTATGAHAGEAQSGPPVLAHVDGAQGMAAGIGPASVASATHALASRERAADEWAVLTAFLGLPADARSVPGNLLSKEIERRLAEADADHDGRVTSSEIRVYATREQDAARRDAIAAVLGAVDADEDGAVTREEQSALTASRSGTTLTPEGLEAAYAGPALAGQRVLGAVVASAETGAR